MNYSDEMIVSSVNHSDYIEMINVYRSFYEESRAKERINFDVDSLIDFFNRLLDDEDGSVALKCTYKGKIVGFRMGGISTMDFSSTPIGFERGFYVLKEYRGTRAAVLLSRAWFDWLDARGVKPAIETVFYADDNEKTYKFCEHMGMREVGRVFERMM